MILIDVPPAYADTIRHVCAAANQMITNQMAAPCQITQVELVADYRVAKVLFQFDDGVECLDFIPVQCFNPYVLTGFAASIFLCNRTAAIRDVLRPYSEIPIYQGGPVPTEPQTTTEDGVEVTDEDGTTKKVRLS